jgi:hypothetical protein
MRRLPIILLICALLLTGGCVEIDWQKTAKQAFAVLVEQGMKVAIDQYGDQKMSAVAWTINYVEKFDWAQPILKWINYEALIEHAYDKVWAQWYGSLREAGYKADDFTARRPKLWYIMDRETPGLNDELVGMMNVD